MVSPGGSVNTTMLHLIAVHIKIDMTVGAHFARPSPTVLGTTVKEKDLGVTISDDMKVLEQCDIAASNGNRIIWLILRI